MFDNTLIKTIKNIWATEKEAQIYLALLQYWWQSASSLSRILTINRSTLYYHLDKLKKKWLIYVSKKTQGETFMANNPNQIISLLNEQVAKAQSKLKTFKDQKITLDELSHKQKIPSQYFLYEGKEAIEIINNRILSSDKAWSIFNFDIISEIMNWDLYFIRDVVKNHKVHSYEIVFDSPRAREYAKICTTWNPEVKVWKNSTPLHVWSVVFEDSYVWITMEDKMQLFEIKDSNIVGLQKSMFDEIRSTI